MKEYKNLIEITRSDDRQRTYALKLGAKIEDLSEEEMTVLWETREYLREKELEELRYYRQYAEEDFKKLYELVKEMQDILKRRGFYEKNYDDCERG